MDAGVWRGISTTSVQITGGVTMCGVICHQFQCDVFRFDKGNKICRYGQVRQSTCSQKSGICNPPEQNVDIYGSKFYFTAIWAFNRANPNLQYLKHLKKDVSRVSQGCFKVISWKFKGSFNYVSRNF